MNRLILVCGLLGVWAPLTGLFAQELSEQRCQELLSELQSGEKAVWRTIPWKLSVLDARREAIDQDKPIFIWAMDGHPLGCT